MPGEISLSEKYVSRSDAIAARQLGGEMMIMSAVDSTFFTLDEVATLIWQAADGKTPLSQIAATICQEFDVDQQQAERDAEEFVNELSKHGILFISENPVPTRQAIQNE
ncbi:MAG: PqqD family protein [Terriglobales bacterium]